MNTKTMENLLAVAEEKSISRAAELLYMSQPTLSHSIQSAERELGFKLFVFSKGQMNLTSAGIVYINGVKAILAEKAALEQKLAELRDETRQRVRLALPPDEYAFVIKYVSPRFREAHPDATLALMKSPPELAAEYLLSGLADLALTVSGTVARYSLAARTLRRDEIVLAVPRAFGELAAGDTANLADFLDKCFFLTAPERGLTWGILRHYGFSPRIVRETGSQWTALQMVVGGYGVALLARSAARLYPKDVAALSLSPPYLFHHCVAYPKEAKLTRTARSLLEILEEAYQKPDGDASEQGQF